MKIAAAQISCKVGDLNENVKKIREFSTRAKDAGVDLVVFPEMADTGYVMRAVQAHAARWSEGAVPQLQEIARTLSVAIISGVSEREGAAIYNAQVSIDPRGEIMTKYRKTHLFSPAPIEEHKCFTAGDAFTTFTMGGLRFGLSICYDLRFPEVYRTLAREDAADAFVISSAWPFPRVEHLRVLATARAIENQSYLILANRVGADDGITFCGSSAIIDPSGTIIAAASADREELIHAEVSTAVIESVRERMPLFEHRREDLYRKCREQAVAPSRGISGEVEGSRGGTEKSHDGIPRLRSG